MADQSAINWFLKHQDFFDLRVSEMAWTEHHAPGLHDFEAKIKFDNRDHIGRGSDHDEDKAILKACAESVERMTCDHYKISSYGVAVHSSTALAGENAYLEMMERIGFFQHFNSGAPFNLIEASNIDWSSFRESYDVKFYTMHTPSDVHGIICLARRKYPDTGAIMGLAAARTTDEAVEKAYIECARRMSARLVTRREPLSRDEFEKIEKPTPIDRQRLLQDEHYFKLVDFLFPEQITKNLSTQKFNFPNRFDFQELTLPLTIYSPLVCVRAKSDFKFEANNTPHFVG